MSQIHHYDHAKNVEAIKARKAVHILFIEWGVEYWDAYPILRELIPDNDEFYPAMRRVRETCVAVKRGETSHALRMVEEYYAGQ